MQGNHYRWQWLVKNGPQAYLSQFKRFSRESTCAIASLTADGSPIAKLCFLNYCVLRNYVGIFLGELYSLYPKSTCFSPLKARITWTPRELGSAGLVVARPPRWTLIYMLGSPMAHTLHVGSNPPIARIGSTTANYLHYILPLTPMINCFESDDKFTYRWRLLVTWAQGPRIIARSTQWNRDRVSLHNGLLVHAAWRHSFTCILILYTLSCQFHLVPPKRCVSKATQRRGGLIGTQSN